jgi:hypothetical protein
MPTTITEIALSAAYRNAQRALADWLERDGALARRKAFSARSAMGRLNAAERHSLARWLAWLCVAMHVRGQSLLARIQRLDALLGAATEEALSRLPGNLGKAAAQQSAFERIVSADTVLRMTSVSSSR